MSLGTRYAPVLVLLAGCSLSCCTQEIPSEPKPTSVTNTSTTEVVKANQERPKAIPTPKPTPTPPKLEPTPTPVAKPAPAESATLSAEQLKLVTETLAAEGFLKPDAPLEGKLAICTKVISCCRAIAAVHGDQKERCDEIASVMAMAKHLKPDAQRQVVEHCNKGLQGFAQIDLPGGLPTACQ